MERISSPIFFLNFLGILAITLRATWCWYRCVFAFGNCSLKIFFRPGSPSIMPRVPPVALIPRLLRSLKNPHQMEENSLSPDCTTQYRSMSSSVPPIATRTETFSIPHRSSWRKGCHRQRCICTMPLKDHAPAILPQHG